MSVVQVTEDIFLVQVPLPFRLNQVNCYVIIADGGWDIIDCGLNYAEAREAWMAALRELGGKFTDIKRIFLTHYHPDHYGLAGWLQEQSGASVYVHSAEKRSIEEVWKRGRTNYPLVGDMFKEHGMPEELADELVQDMLKMLPLVQPYPQCDFLTGNEELTMAGNIFRLLHTPGHSDGHVCYFCEREGILFSGDHLLPKISSNISLWPTSHPNPLEHFLRSLEIVGCLPVKSVLPAHGPVFSDCAKRVDELLCHHQQRLLQICRIMGRDEKTAFQICQALFGAGLNNHEQRFAMAETLSHLAYLESRARISSRHIGGKIFFRLTASFPE
ncbi:MAG: MBL fold metallo-hydrolase [Bacillota bacterium]|uniref:MBL fold metallo-hydrolase n=1 Tax=Desulfurispora thermophila TaxID=265470 RepID=UPI00037A3A93|nr:MBL fold metallo-hydrolase [Desulfurispora thermophila]